MVAVVKVQREGSNQAGVKFKMTASTAEVMRRQCFSEAPGRPLPSTSSPRSPQFSRAKATQQLRAEPSRCKRPGAPPTGPVIQAANSLGDAFNSGCRCWAGSCSIPGRAHHPESVEG